MASLSRDLEWPEVLPDDLDPLTCDFTPQFAKYSMESLMRCGAEAVLAKGVHKGASYMAVATERARFCEWVLQNRSPASWFRQWLAAYLAHGGLLGQSAELMDVDPGDAVDVEMAEASGRG